MKPKDLPDNQSEYWEGEKHIGSPAPLQICPTHTKDGWYKGINEYKLNPDGSVSCHRCPWGTKLPGYMRCIEGQIVDLRSVNSS